jgi:hypothetical protein
VRVEINVRRQGHDEGEKVGSLIVFQWLNQSQQDRRGVHEFEVDFASCRKGMVIWVLPENGQAGAGWLYLQDGWKIPGCTSSPLPRLK